MDDQFALEDIGAPCANRAWRWQIVVRWAVATVVFLAFLALTLAVAIAHPQPRLFHFYVRDRRSRSWLPSVVSVIITPISIDYAFLCCSPVQCILPMTLYSGPHNDSQKFRSCTPIRDCHMPACKVLPHVCCCIPVCKGTCCTPSHAPCSHHKDTFQD